MKQISTKREEKSNEDVAGAPAIGMIVAAMVGAVEGIIAYFLLINLDKAEVLSISPRPAYMVSVGVAWRFLRQIDNFLRR